MLYHLARLPDAFTLNGTGSDTRLSDAPVNTPAKALQLAVDVRPQSLQVAVRGDVTVMSLLPRRLSDFFSLSDFDGRSLSLFLSIISRIPVSNGLHFHPLRFSCCRHLCCPMELPVLQVMIPSLGLFSGRIPH
jgi:hypothetical protein